ncbi:MAG: hypothetical protein Q4G60_04110 [bacterium]|nr:hypothetical protein [bacterium]
MKKSSQYTENDISELTSDIQLTHYQIYDTLSIDRTQSEKVIIIKLSIQSKRKEVLAFLAELKKILEDKEFSVDNDLTIIRSKKAKGKEIYSTPYTLLDLDYDSKDIVDRLKELSIKEYSETLVDVDDLKPPILFVFGKDIHDKLVYIKLKIKGDQPRHVLCVSFHYAEQSMIFPFA